jgi:hypothetical protein
MSSHSCLSLLSLDHFSGSGSVLPWFCLAVGADQFLGRVLDARVCLFKLEFTLKVRIQAFFSSIMAFS